MATRHFICDNGRCHHRGQAYTAPSNAGMQVFGKLGGLGAGALLGGGASKHPVGAAVGAAVGLGLGHLLDVLVAPKCPMCGVALQALATVV